MEITLKNNCQKYLVVIFFIVHLQCSTKCNTCIVLILKYIVNISVKVSYSRNAIYKNAKALC